MKYQVSYISSNGKEEYLIHKRKSLEAAFSAARTMCEKWGATSASVTNVKTGREWKVSNE